MKKIIILSLAAAAFLLQAAGPLEISLDPAVNSRTAHEIGMGRAVFNKEQKVYTLKCSDKLEAWRGVNFTIPVKAVPGKKIRFEGEYCCSIDNKEGAAFTALRQHDKKGGSISYSGNVDMKGKSDWKRFSKEFAISDKADGNLELYFITKKCNAKSTASLRNVKVTEL